MSERSQDELRLAAISKFGEIKEFTEGRFLGYLYEVSGDPESGRFSLHTSFGDLTKNIDYAFLGEAGDRKIIASRRRSWSDTAITYQDGLVECQYNVHPPTEAIIITLTQVGLDHAMLHAIGAVYLESILGTVSIALGESARDWNKQLVFSVSQEPLTITAELGSGADKKVEAVALDKLFNPPEVYPYGFRIHPEVSNLLFQRVFLGSTPTQIAYQRNWLLTLPFRTNFHKLNTQANAEEDWTKVNETLPVNIQMLSGNLLS